MASLSQESVDLSELVNDLDVGEYDETDVVAAGKAKGKKKSKKKKAATNTTVSNGGEFGFSAARTRLINIGYHEVKGRTLVASVSLPAGTIFFSERAVATVSHTNELCLHCGKVVVTPIADPSFPSALFCCVECQTIVRSDALRYKYLHLLSLNVDQIAKTHCCDKDLLHMVFRLLAQSLFPAPSVVAGTLCQDTDGVITATLRGVNTLEAHLEQQPVAWVTAVTAGIQAVLENLNTDVDLRNLLSTAVYGANEANPSSSVAEYALFLACIVNVNAYGIVNYQSTSAHSMGFGLFPAVGLCVNHACSPNSYYTYSAQNGCMEYRTIKDVQAGEELTVSYTDIFLDTPQRRTALYEKRFFLCQCSRCAGYDLAENTVLSIHNTLTTSESAAGAKKKKNKAEEDAFKATLSPFYQPKSGVTADDALLDEWADEAAPATNSKKNAKGKPKPTLSVGDGGTQGKVATAAGNKDACALGSSLKNVVADAMLSGLCCEVCGAAGVVMAVGIAKGTEPTAAACIVCTTLVDPITAHVSLERCRAQWRICQDTLHYTVPGAAGSALVEKFLQEADPEYAMYTSCTAFQSSGGAAGVVVAASTAQAVALERRRKLKCPVQLHTQHATLSEAYLLLYDHLWVQYQQAEQSGASGSGIVALLAKVLYCLRRVIQSRRALFQPIFHPEVGATQYLLASVLQTALRHVSKSSAIVKELKKECADLLNEVISSRVNAFGDDHDLTRKAKTLQDQIIM